MNKSNKRGFTLIELMAVVAVIGTLGVLAIWGLTRLLATGAGENQELATKQATAWATQMRFEGANVSCTEATHGKQGMVPCTVAVPIKGSLPAIYGIECAGAYNIKGQAGCRIVTAPVVQPAFAPAAPPASSP